MIRFLKARSPATDMGHVDPAHKSRVQAFGQSLTLTHTGNAHESAARLTDLRTIHEPFLASRVIPKAGLCLDIGAGAGWFAIPFARAFSNWQVICLEADPEAFAHLQANVRAHGLKNILCINAAFHPDAAPRNLTPRKPQELELPAALVKALQQGEAMRFQKLLALGPRIAPAPEAAAPLPEHVQRPALPLDMICALAPDLIKLDAPGCEQAIARTLKTGANSFICGRLYTYVPTPEFTPQTGTREHYLVYGTHALRRDYEDNFDSRKARLDVVVAMYNTRDFIIECVDSVLADNNPDIRVIVVDDGSTDGCGALVQQHYARNARVQLVRKANGGCASARNYGRRCSDATHIAFIDADDRVDPEMFSELLEVARYTGANVTEAEFQLLVVDEDGTEKITPSYEAAIYNKPGQYRLGKIDYSWFHSSTTITRQPTIWRRIHRRDFLDRQRLWFPEHVRAFDDQIFQLMLGQLAGDIAHVRNRFYHYRQHPAQDIKQGDERHFYSFNMFRNVFLRALDEQWNSLDPFYQSLLNTMNWSYSSIRDDLKPIYMEAAAEFIAITQKTFGHKFRENQLQNSSINGLDILVRHKLDRMHDVPVNYGLMRLESWRWQPEMIRMMQRVKA